MELVYTTGAISSDLYRVSVWDINIWFFLKMFYDRKLLHACLYGLGVNKNVFRSNTQSF